MLRINLLPSYVAQRRLTRKLSAGFAALFVACIVVPSLIYLSDVGTLHDTQQKADAAEAGKKITDTLKQQASDQRSQIAPLEAKVNYVKSVHQHNLDIVKFWSTVAQYSDPKVIYTDASVSGTALTLKAFTPSISEIGRYLLTMYQEPDFATVAIDKLPGYPEALVNKYYLDGKLIAIGSSSASSGGGSSSTGGSASGPGYGSPAPIGPTGSVTNVPVINDTSSATSQSGGQGGSKPTGGQPLSDQDLYTALSTSQTFIALYNNQTNPFATPEQKANNVLQVIRRVRRKTEPKGFQVTITATLKQPLIAPALPGVGAAASPGGAPGGPPIGPPGARPGPPGSTS